MKRGFLTLANLTLANLTLANLTLIGLLAGLSGQAAAQTYTTAAEVKPILSATKQSWIAVREYEGQDLLYFTNLLAWRCGVSTVTYAVNGAAPTALALEPCHEDTAQPNALLMQEILPYVALPLGSIDTVTVSVTYDDDTTDNGAYQRAAVMTP